MKSFVRHPHVGSDQRGAVTLFSAMTILATFARGKIMTPLPVGTSALEEVARVTSEADQW